MNKTSHPGFRVVALLLVFCLSASVLAPVALASEASGAASPETAGGGAAPTQPPVSIVAPETECTVQAGEMVKVLVVVNVPDVSAVAVLCDDKGIEMFSAPPYSADWDTSGIPTGKHLLRAFAYLKSGEKVGAAPVIVNIVERTGEKESAAPPQPAAQPTVLKDGTAVTLKTMESMTSGKVATGTAVRYKVVRDVVGPGGQVLIPYDANGYGKVTESHRRGMLGKKGSLSFTIEYVEAVDGTQVPLRAKAGASGRSNQGVVVAAALFLTVLAIFVSGRDVTVPAGTEITAYVNHDTAIGALGAPRAPSAATQASVYSVAIEYPRNGRKLYVGATPKVILQVHPAAQASTAVLILNGQPLGAPTEHLAELMLDTKGLPPGDYRLEAEVAFQGGPVIRSEPVALTIAERVAAPSN